MTPIEAKDVVRDRLVGGPAPQHMQPPCVAVVVEPVAGDDVVVNADGRRTESDRRGRRSSPGLMPVNSLPGPTSRRGLRAGCRLSSLATIPAEVRVRDGAASHRQNRHHPRCSNALQFRHPDVDRVDVVQAIVVEEDVAVGEHCRHATQPGGCKGDVIEGRDSCCWRQSDWWLPIAIVAAVPDESPTPVKFSLRTLVSDTFPTVTVAVEAGCTVTTDE